MTALLPPLPGSEPLDRRVGAAFLALTVVLIVPSLVGVFAPYDQQALGDVRDDLASQARQVLATVDAQDHTTERYFSAAIQDVGERARGIHDELVRRTAVTDASSMRDSLAQLADDLSAEADQLSLAYGDDAALAAGRSRVEAIAIELQAFAP
jgi:hypothetical protein